MNSRDFPKKSTRAPYVKLKRRIQSIALYAKIFCVRLIYLKPRCFHFANLKYSIHNRTGLSVHSSLNWSPDHSLNWSPSFNVWSPDYQFHVKICRLTKYSVVTNKTGHHRMEPNICKRCAYLLQWLNVVRCFVIYCLRCIYSYTRIRVERKVALNTNYDKFSANFRNSHWRSYPVKFP